MENSSFIERGTFKLYQAENLFSRAVRVQMKETVDRDILDTAVNTAIRRYPYFAVFITVDNDGGYVLQKNHRKVVVLPEKDRVIGGEIAHNPSAASERE